MFWDIFWRNKNGISLGFCLSFSVLCLIWQGNIFARGASVIGKLSDRLSGALSSSLRATGTIWVEIDRYRELEARYAAAQKRLEEYRLEKDKFDHLLRENIRLRRLFGFSRLTEYPEIKAEVLSIRLNSISPRIIINRGTKDGVNIYMPVITRAHDADQNLIRCVVGMVIDVDSNSAVVQPLVHAGFRLGVRLPESGRWAVLSGNSGSITEAELIYIARDFSPEKATVDHTESPLKPGTAVVTSGAGGIFPGGIPVGTLQREGGRDGEFRTAFIRPYAPLSNLDYVTVIQKKPEVWARKKAKGKDWEEHLITPFGTPEFPEELRIAKTEHKKPAPAKLPEKKADEKKKSEEKKENKKLREQRRLQNLKGP